MCAVTRPRPRARPVVVPAGRALESFAVAILAHLDDPPRSRWPGILVGLALAVPVGAVIIAWVIPALVNAVLGGARDLDGRLRAEDAYMQALCTTALDPERDEQLCGCVLGTEYPSLDCQLPFRQWTLARQRESCSDAGTFEAAKSFCTCVDVVGGKVDAATPETRDTEAAAYENCMALPDALFLPTIDVLAPAGS